MAFAVVEKGYEVRVLSFLSPSVACGVIPLPAQLRYNHGNRRLCNAGQCEPCCRSNGRPLTGQISFLSFLPFSRCAGKKQLLTASNEVGVCWLFGHEASKIVFHAADDEMRLCMYYILCAQAYSACLLCVIVFRYEGVVSTVCSVM